MKRTNYDDVSPFKHRVVEEVLEVDSKRDEVKRATMLSPYLARKTESKVLAFGERLEV